MNTGGPCSGLPDSCTRPSHRSVTNHLTCPSVAFTRYPSARWASHHGWVWASPLGSRLATSPGRNAFVILRTDGSPPVTPHPASRRRSYLRLQAGERLPEGDLHTPDRVHSQAYCHCSVSSADDDWDPLAIAPPTHKNSTSPRRVGRGLVWRDQPTRVGAEISLIVNLPPRDPAARPDHPPAGAIYRGSRSAPA